jgi:hypothetical protein
MLWFSTFYFFWSFGGWGAIIWKATIWLSKTNRIKEMKKIYRRHETHTTASLRRPRPLDANLTGRLYTAAGSVDRWHLLTTLCSPSPPPLSLLKFLGQRETIRENEISRKDKSCWKFVASDISNVLLPSNSFHSQVQIGYLKMEHLSQTPKLGRVFLNLRKKK